MKVSDLAEELNTTPKKFMGFLEEMGVRVKSPTAKLDPKTVSEAKKLYKELEEENSLDEIHRVEKVFRPTSPTLTVNQLVALLEVPLPGVMRVFLEKGLLLNINSEVDINTAVDVADRLNITLKIEKDEEKAIALKTKIMEMDDQVDREAKGIEKRPPVITIMGHVDHGKTRLLDTIRSTNVIAKEAGGITQHIGAYQVKLADGSLLTFLDTPGHEAFTSLRARGAQITDIAILVVAADDGVKPQTVEAIHHAQAADVPIIVALNKVDKPEADIEKCKQQLSQYNLISEDWGGTVVMVPISAKAGDGVPHLLEMISLTAEMLELTSTKKGRAKGIIIESNLSKQKGPIGTVLVKSGTLKVGDHFVVGSIYGKVRAMFNDKGKPVIKAEPSMPVEILGLSDVPQPGDVLEVIGTEKEAKTIVAERQYLNKETKFRGQQSKMSLEAISSQIEDGQVKQLNLIIKADVNGSVEAIKASIDKMDNLDVPIHILHAATGTINENDVMLAKASSAIITGFGVSVNNEATKLAADEDVEIKTYEIIYELLEDLERAVRGLYKPEYEEVEVGQIEVRQLFSFSKVGTIAGSYVTDGTVTRNAIARVFRGGKEIYVGKVESLKRFKDDAKEVKAGFECGIVLEKFTDLQEGDRIKVYKLQEIKRGK